MIGRSPGPVHAVFGTRIAPETAMASPVADVEPYSTFQAATGAAISLAGSAYTVICCALITSPGAAAAAGSPAAYAGPVSAATQSRAIPTERRRRARRITAPRSFTMAGTAGRSAVLQHPVDPGEKVGDDLLAVGLVEHLVPRLGVRVDSDVGEPCRPVPVDQRVQQGECGVAGERDGGDLVAVVEQVLLSGERAHAVRDQDQRQPGMLVVHVTGQPTEVVDQQFPAVGAELTEVRVRVGARPVAAVVLAVHHDAGVGERLRQLLVPQHVLTHAVGELGGGDRLAGRVPPVRRDVATVSSGVGEPRGGHGGFLPRCGGRFRHRHAVRSALLAALAAWLRSRISAQDWSLNEVNPANVLGPASIWPPSIAIVWPVR